MSRCETPIDEWSKTYSLADLWRITHTVMTNTFVLAVFIHTKYRMVKTILSAMRPVPTMRKQSKILNHHLNCDFACIPHNMLYTVNFIKLTIFLFILRIMHNYSHNIFQISNISVCINLNFSTFLQNCITYCIHVLAHTSVQTFKLIILTILLNKIFIFHIEYK